MRGIDRRKKAKSKRGGSFSSSSKRTFLTYFFRWELLIIAAAVVCDVNSWGHQFVIDDRGYIVDNLFIQNYKNLFRLLISPMVPLELGVGHIYRPLTAVTLGLNCWASGLHPDGFHLVNRLIHVMVCLGIYWVLRRLLSDITAAGLTAILFAVHPIQTEAVTYITGRSDALAMLFFVLGWFFHIRARQSGEKEMHSFAAPLVFYLLSLMSKEGGITWIGVILLTELIYFSKASWAAFRQNLHKGLWKIFVLYLLVPVVFLGFRAFATGRTLPVYRNISIIDNPLAHSQFLAGKLTALKVLLQSLGLILWPVRLSADYSYNQIALISDWSSPGGLAVVTAVLALLVFLVWIYRRAPDIFFGLGFFLVTYSVVSNLVFKIGTIRADRVLYMPMLGILLAIAVLISGVARRIERRGARTIFRSAVIVVVALLALRTIQRNDDWKNDLTIALETVEASPGSFRAHHHLGTAYLGRGNLVPALEQYRIAESIFPDDATLLSDFGLVLTRLGRTEEAIQYYRRAIALAPRFPMIRFNFSRTLRAAGDIEGAQKQDEAILEFYDGLIRQSPDDANHHYFKANALVFQGKLEQALSEFQKTLHIDPNYPNAQYSIDQIRRQLAPVRQR